MLKQLRTNVSILKYLAISCKSFKKSHPAMFQSDVNHNQCWILLPVIKFFLPNRKNIYQLLSQVPAVRILCKISCKVLRFTEIC